MFRKIIVVLSMLTVAANIIIAEELQVAKNTSIGLYYDWQSITMSDYLTAKIGTANEYINYLNNKALLKGFLPDYYLSITCPQNLANYGVRLSYKVTDEFAINIHGFTSSISGTDSLNWTDSSNDYVNYTSKWKFNINDVGMGI